MISRLHRSCVSGRCRRMLFHLHHDRLRLRLADPDRKQPVAALLLQDHDVAVVEAVEPQPRDDYFDHVPSRPSAARTGGPLASGLRSTHPARRPGRRRHVPMSHDARYFCCSGVSVSTSEPIAASLSRAISRSTASGTRCTLARQRLRVLHEILRAERLVREAHVHDARRMSFGRREVDQPALAQHEHALPADDVLLDELPHLARRDDPRALRAPVRSISTLKCPELQTIAPSFIARKCSLPDHVHVAGERAEDVADRRRVRHRHHAEAVHRRLERLERIDLGDDDVGAGAARARCDAAAAPAVAGRRRTSSPRGAELVARMMPSIVDCPVP